MQESVLISVILATYNWPQALRLCLQSLATQTDQGFEVWIADDGSNIETAELIAQFQTNFCVALHHVWQEDIGFRKSKILNRAISNCQGQYLVFLDGDCVVQPDFIERHRALSQPCSMITGSRILLNPTLTQTLCEQAKWDFSIFKNKALGYWITGKLNKFLPLWFKFPDLRTRNYRRFKWSRIKGCNMAAWRKDVLRIGGFDEGLEGWGHEDADFVFRLQQAGITRKSGSWATEVLHLWHKTQNKESAAKNAAIVRAKIVAKNNA